jgi:ornithine cyclodeaminase/alanine dehydrogenase-like protein (mu-crystallin family)
MEKISRRRFLKSSATAASMTALGTSLQARAYAAGTGAMKLGLIGCGGRGTGAAVQALNACRPAKLVAMADVFDDRIEKSYKSILKRHPDSVDVPPVHFETAP